MSIKSATFASAVADLQIEDTHAQETYNVAGQRPDEIASHSLAREIIIVGISPSDFVNTHSAISFNFTQLMTDFRAICDDYANDLVWNAKSKALDFCSKILFEVGPESRKVTRQTGDKTWAFKFMSADDTKKLIVKSAFVSTFKGEGIEYKRPLGNL